MDFWFPKNHLVDSSRRLNCRQLLVFNSIWYAAARHLFSFFFFLYRFNNFIVFVGLIEVAALIFDGEDADFRDDWLRKKEDITMSMT